jgi:hypothetical protein
VPDLRQEIGAGRPVGLGERARFRGLAEPGAAPHFTMFKHVPHVCAALRRIGS